MREGDSLSTSIYRKVKIVNTQHMDIAMKLRFLVDIGTYR
jgi:hypothetical protein